MEGRGRGKQEKSKERKATQSRKGREEKVRENRERSFCVLVLPLNSKYCVHLVERIEEGFLIVSIRRVLFKVDTPLQHASTSLTTILQYYSLEPR